jgi:hypothetical protein
MKIINNNLKKSGLFLLSIVLLVVITSLSGIINKTNHPSTKDSELLNDSQKTDPNSNKIIDPVDTNPIETAKEALELAKNDNKYLFILFFDKDDHLLKAMEDELKDFLSISPEETFIYKASTKNNKDAEIVTKYGINRTPLPVLLIFAPNGAITGGFPQTVSHQQLTKCFVPELTMKILKNLQDRRIVLVLLQNNNTKYNRESTKAANDFSIDPKFSGLVEIIKKNPDDSKIKDFLVQCKIDKGITEATTVLIVPPGVIGGVYTGKINKETLLTGLSSCKPGSSCCPR